MVIITRYIIYRVRSDENPINVTAVVADAFPTVFNFVNDRARFRSLRGGDKSNRVLRAPPALAGPFPLAHPRRGR